MHNAAHRADDRNAVYLPLQAVDAADVLAFAEAFDVRGLSVTLPFKVDLLPHCEPDALATRVGAVNTLAPIGGGVARIQHRRAGPARAAAPSVST